MLSPSFPPSLRFAAVVVVLLIAPSQARAQRAAITPLVAARPAARIALPEVLAVAVDSTFLVLRPSLFEPRNIMRVDKGRWTTVESAVQRDSLFAVREVVGKAVSLHAEGEPVGAGRVRAVRPGRCAEPPGWCPPTAAIEVLGQAEPAARPLVAVNPPPSHSSPPAEATEDESAAAANALLAAARTAVGRRGRVRDDQLGTPAVFVFDDSARHARILVAAGMVEQGKSRPLSALVVGIGGDTLVRSAVGRATALAPGSTEELRFVTVLDLDGDGRDELLLSWQSGSEWQFEILAADRAGRWTRQWRGPDRTLPAAGRRSSSSRAPQAGGPRP